MLGTTSTDWVTGIESPQTSSYGEGPIGDNGLIGSQEHGRVDVPVGNDPSVSANPPSESEPCECVTGSKVVARLPLKSFAPFVDVFFERLYAVFPVIDKTCVMVYLQSDDDPLQLLPTSFYSFLAALSAAVIVQLNTSDAGVLQPRVDTPEDLTCTRARAPSAQFFADQCLQTRREQGFIEDANEWTVLTSFFLFAYYGNLDRSRLAWYYLREAIGFAQALGLDEAESYDGLDVGTQQRRRRLFWLLFVSERFALRFPIHTKHLLNTDFTDRALSITQELIHFNTGESLR
jgi:hypothetical protein